MEKIKPLTQLEIKKAVDEEIEGIGAAYYEAVHCFTEGMKKAIEVLNERNKINEKK